MKQSSRKLQLALIVLVKQQNRHNIFKSHNAKLVVLPDRRAGLGAGFDW
jgi:hypothetical protein